MPDDDDDDLQGDPFDEAQLAALETIQDEDVFFQENQVFFQDDVFSWNNQPSEAERTGDASNLVPVFQPADVAPSGIDTAYGYAISLLDPALGATAHLPMDLTGLTLESGNGKYIYCSETEKPASFVYEWILQASETGLEVGDMEFSDVDIEYRAQRINLHKKCQNQGINVPAIERVEVVESDDRLVFRVKVTALHDEVQFTYSQNISEKMAMFSAVAETMQALHSSNIYHGDADLSNFFVQRCPQSQGPGRFKAYAVDLDDVGEQIGPSPVWRPDDRSDSKRDDVRKLADEFSNTIRRHLEANKSDVADARQRNLLTSAKKFFDRVADAQRYPNCTIEELCTYLKRFDALYHATGSESH